MDLVGQGPMSFVGLIQVSVKEEPVLATDDQRLIKGRLIQGLADTKSVIVAKTPVDQELHLIVCYAATSLRKKSGYSSRKNAD